MTVRKRIRDAISGQFIQRYEAMPDTSVEETVKPRDDLAERLLALLKRIAETPESKDTIQVWAWTAVKENEGFVLADDPQNPANQVPDFSKKKG